MKAYLPIDKMPKSCKECKSRFGVRIRGLCYLHDSLFEFHKNQESRHPDCLLRVAVDWRPTMAQAREMLGEAVGKIICIETVLKWQDKKDKLLLAIDALLKEAGDNG